MIVGIKSPSSNEKLLDSAFADDANFFIKNLISLKNILITFDRFGSASGSKMNIDNKSNTQQPYDIKWVTNTKSLGIKFFYDDNDSKNWIPLIDKFGFAIMQHISRKTSLFGKASILNSIVFSTEVLGSDLGSTWILMPWSLPNASQQSIGAWIRAWIHLDPLGS